MNRIAGKVVILIISLMLIIGCSTGGNNPTEVSNFINDVNHNLPVAELDGISANHSLCGIWKASFNIESLSATIQPNRTLNAHHNVTGMIPAPLITVNSWDPVEEVIDVDIQLHNPTWATGYDVRLIIFTDDDGHTLLNADNWTPTWDIPGGQIANPFKAYAKHEINRAFTGLMWHQENFQIKCPNLNFNVQFAVDASYPGNCEEPYEISNFQHTTLKPDIGSEATLHVDISDWQDELSDVVIAAPQITGVAFTSFEYDSGDTWSTQIINNNGAAAGSYNCFIKATCMNPPGISIYDLVTIQVKEKKQGWVATGGGSFNDWLYGCTLDQEGNIYVTGYAEWLPSPRRMAIFLYKYSNTGKFLWGHLFYCDDNAVGYSVACDNSNNVYLTGSFDNTIDFDPGAALLELTPIYRDAFLCKYDPDGNLVWGFNWGGNDGAHSRDIAFNGVDELSLACREGFDLSIRFFNLDGDSTDSIILTGEGTNDPYAVAYDSSDNIYVTGQYSKTLDFDDGPGEDIHESYWSIADCFLFKYDSSRNFQWAQTWGSNFFDDSRDVAVDSLSNAFVIGSFEDSCDFDPGPEIDARNASGPNDIFLVKYDTNGIYNWVHSWGGTDSGFIEYGDSVTIDSDNNIIATGSFTGTDVDLDPGPDEDLHDVWGALDFFVSKFNADGDFLKALTLGGGGDYCYASICDSNNNIYIGGAYYGCTDFDPGLDEYIQCATNMSDIYVAKYSSEGLW